MKKITALFLTIFLIGNFLCSCSKKEEKQTIYCSLPGEPETLDPQAANDSNAKTVIANIFEGLLKVDGSGNITEAAASSYKENEYKTNYVFYLREDLKWSNGENLTADDFVFGIKRALSKEFEDITSNGLLSIRNAENYRHGKCDFSEVGIRSAGSSTLIIDLETINDDFLYSLTTPSAMPCNENFFNKTAGQYGKESKTIISNGMYYVKENYGWSHNEYVTLYENEYYNGSESGCVGINFIIDDGKSYNIDSVINSELDCIITDGIYKEKARQNNLGITTYSDAVCGIRFNTKDSIYKNLFLRLALLQSLKRDEILVSVPQSHSAAHNILSNDLKLLRKSYRSFEENTFTLDYSDDFKEILNKGLKEENLKTLQSFTLLYCDDEVSSLLASNIISIWNKAFGLYINKEAVGENELLSRIENNNFTVAIAPLKYSSENAYETLKKLNIDYPLYKNLFLTDSDVLDSCITAERYISDNALFYPLYYTEKMFVAGNSITGVQFFPYSDCISFINAVKNKER